MIFFKKNSFALLSIEKQLTQQKDDFFANLDHEQKMSGAIAFTKGWEILEKQFTAISSAEGGYS